MTQDETLDAYKAQLREQSAARRAASLTAEQARQRFDQLYGPIPVPPGCLIKPIPNGEQIIPTCGTTGKAMLYHHGGGHAVGSIKSHRHFVARLAEACGIVAFNMSYRLAPEHPFPAGLDDALANYKRVLEAGFAPDDVVLAGESAGGNLTVALLLRLRDEGMAMPAGAYLLSPWLDLEHRGASHADNAARDPIFTRDDLEGAAKSYAGTTPRSNPLISPLRADLTGLPPLLLQVSSDEILLSDFSRLRPQSRSSRRHRYAADL